MEEDIMSGYETIVIPTGAGGRRMNPGVPLGSRVVVNSRIHQPGNYKQRAWNNSRGGVIIHHLSAGPPHHRKMSPRIVEVTDEEDDVGIANPDYPVSEAGFNGRSDMYPSQLPAYNESPELPARDYHLHGNNDPESRPDIQRLDLSGQNEEPSSVIFVPPAPPPPPPPPPVPQSQQPDAVVVDTPEKPMDASSPSVQGSTETHAGQQLPEDYQGLHIVLRRALARFNDDTTQPTPEDDGGPILPDENQDGEGPDEIANKRASREIYTQTRQQQSAEVQTPPEQPKSSHDDDSDKDKRRTGAEEADRKSKSRSHDDRRSKQRDERYWHESGPQFTNYDPEIDDHRASQAPYISGVDLEDGVRRASTIIERIIITREIDPVTGRPLESVPMRNMDPRPRPKPAPARPASNHGNVVYNQSVRAGSGRKTRGWAPFSDWHGHWSPREQADPTDVSGIVAGMEGEAPEVVENQRQSYGYMPGERTAQRRGRSNQGYDVSPVEERRHRPNGERKSATQPKAGARPESFAKANATATHPLAYTARDAAPSRMRDRPPLPIPHEVNPAHRSFREKGWGGHSDRSSTIRAGWPRNTRLKFAVMLLLCILLLLALVVVVVLYFTAGPGSDCVSGAVCGTPPLGYIVAFAVIGFFAVTFTFIGLMMCCFACCSFSREKRMQQYPVSG